MVSFLRSVAERPPLRVSIRYKLLLAITAVLLLAVGAYVSLATSLFTRDKLADVFELNSSLVKTLAEQVRADVTIAGQTLSLFARDAAATQVAPARRQAVASELFQLAPELVRLELYRREGETLRREERFDNPLQLERLGLSARDLEELERRQPLPLRAIAARPGDIHAENASLPPGAPLLLLALSPTSAPDVVVVGVLHHERLLRVFASSPLQQTYLLDEQGTVLASGDPLEVVKRRRLTDHPLIARALLGSTGSEVREFRTAEGAQMVGALARVEVGRLWVISQLPRDEALRTTRELIRRSVYFAVAVVLGGVLVSIFLSRLVTSPIRRLRAATEVVGQGRFEITVDERAGDEIGDLARSFVQMARTLRQAQAQLVRSEKLAAFGQLGAGITHELKNPLTGIVGFAQIAQRKLDQREKLEELLKLIEVEGLRCKDILVNFLKFARHQSGQDARPVGVNELVTTSAKVFAHQLSMHSVRVELELAPDAPEVMVNSGELQQVLLNLAINAQQAMSSGGTVRVSTRAEDGWARISVEDDGPGIPEAIREQIFEPFFTTKPPGEGTGLGLAISDGIVRDHGGTLTVDSVVGRGTTFTLRLPLASARAAGIPASARRVANG